MDIFNYFFGQPKQNQKCTKCTISVLVCYESDPNYTKSQYITLPLLLVLVHFLLFDKSNCVSYPNPGLSRLCRALASPALLVHSKY